MSSEIRNANHPTPVQAETINIPRMPQDINDEILNHLVTDSDLRSIRSCALISKSWVQSCRRHLFHTVDLTLKEVDRWFKAFPVPEESPAHHVKDLRVQIGGRGHVPDEFFEYIPWFTDVERISLVGHMGLPSSLRPSLWDPPQSITSLTLNTSVVTLVQIRDIMAPLSNLDDLTLIGSLVPVDRGELPGIGTVVRGRFSGKLKLCGDFVGVDVVNMLLEIPSGPRFTEVLTHSTCECLPSAVRLAEACCETIVKLTHSPSCQCESQPFPQSNEISALTPFSDVDVCEAFEQSFDLSKFPNLQEFKCVFRVGRAGGRLPWIHLALATLRPATSPRLSTIRLDFAGPPVIAGFVETLIANTGSDLRRIADEVSRIKREFKGTVDVNVVRDSLFGAALDVLNVSFRSWGGRDLVVISIHLSSTPGPSGR